MFTYSIKREIRHFHVVVVQKSANLLFLCVFFFWRSRCRPRRWILKSLIITWRIRQTVNVRFKLWISRNRKWGDKNGSKQLLWFKKLREITDLWVEIMNSTSEGDKWRGNLVTWYKFAFDVNVKLTLYYFFFQFDLNPDPSLISVKNNLASLCEMRGSSKNGRMYNYQILYMLCNKLCFAFRISNHDL